MICPSFLKIMQELVEYYSKKGWLQRVEQCVLHMDISSLDFNQVLVRSIEICLLSLNFFYGHSC
jgi:hypothetical protein